MKEDTTTAAVSKHTFAEARPRDSLPPSLFPFYTNSQHSHTHQHTSEHAQDLPQFLEIFIEQVAGHCYDQHNASCTLNMYTPSWAIPCIWATIQYCVSHNMNHALSAVFSKPKADALQHNRMFEYSISKCRFSCHKNLRLDVQTS